MTAYSKRARYGRLDAPSHVGVQFGMAHALARSRAYGGPTGTLQRWAGNPL